MHLQTSPAALKRCQRRLRNCWDFTASELGWDATAVITNHVQVNVRNSVLIQTIRVGGADAEMKVIIWYAFSGRPGTSPGVKYSIPLNTLVPCSQNGSQLCDADKRLKAATAIESRDAERRYRKLYGHLWTSANYVGNIYDGLRKLPRRIDMAI